MAERHFVFPDNERQMMVRMPVNLIVYQFYGGYFHILLVTRQMQTLMRWGDEEQAQIISVEIPRELVTEVEGEKRTYKAEVHEVERADSLLHYATYMDVTETRKRLFAQRTQKKIRLDFFQKILDTTQECIFWKDERRRFVGVNRAFLEFYGFPSVDILIGKTDEDMGWHPEPEKFMQDELRVLQGESTRLVHGTCIIRGKTRDILASKSPLYEEGRIIGLVGSFIDVTDQYEQERRSNILKEEKEIALLEAEQAKQGMSNFIMRASHEMRTPLNAILGFTYLAEPETDVGELKDYLKKIQVSGRLLTDLVNDILDIRKTEDGSMQLLPRPMVLSDLLHNIDDMISILAQQKGILFYTELSFLQDEFVMCDQVRLQQVLMNLLNNSIKFTDEGGSVSLTVREESINARISEFTFEVKDTGCGMSKEFIDRIFDPFAQENRNVAKYGVGTGLGLTITKRMVDLMSGTIDVESIEHEGSKFTVKIPLTLSDKTEYHGFITGSNKEGKRSFEITGLHFLVVEDNLINQEVAVGILEQEGATSDVADNGLEAIDKFKDSEPGKYDAILMDIHMPLMDGMEATRNLRILDHPDAKTIPIMAMSAEAFDESIEECLECGMNGYIRKPINVVELKRTIGANIRGLDE
ncbi:MAG: response regulator [Lachnospiraceae bacterium]|nr:response regulator [Lachnospiraceae bacterium]